MGSASCVDCTSSRAEMLAGGARRGRSTATSQARDQGLSPEVAAPMARALQALRRRRTLMWDEYSPSRRSRAPTSPGCLQASTSLKIRSLVGRPASRGYSTVRWPWAVSSGPVRGGAGGPLTASHPSLTPVPTLRVGRFDPQRIKRCARRHGGRIAPLTASGRRAGERFS